MAKSRNLSDPLTTTFKILLYSLEENSLSSLTSYLTQQVKAKREPLSAQDEGNDTEIGAEYTFALSFAGRERSLTVTELAHFPPTAGRTKDTLSRYQKANCYEVDAVVLMGKIVPPHKGTSQAICDFGIDTNTPTFYITPKATAAQAQADLSHLDQQEFKYLIVSSSLPNLSVEEGEALFRLILGCIGQALPLGPQLDLSATKISRVTVLNGKGLMAADLSGKSDPFCKIAIGTALGKYTTPVHATKPKKQTLDPVWTASDKPSKEFEFSNYGKETLFIEIWDQDMIGADRMGYVSVAVADLKLGELTLTVKPTKKEKATGTLTISIE